MAKKVAKQKAQKKAKKKAKKKRVYKKGAKGSEYDSYHGLPEQIKRRQERNATRRKEQAKRKKAGKKPLPTRVHMHHTTKKTSGPAKPMSGGANQRKGSPGSRASRR